jgi:hypothetical protein
VLSSDDGIFLSNIMRLWSYSQNFIKNTSYEGTLFAGTSFILKEESFFDEYQSNIPKAILLSTKRYIMVNFTLKMLNALKERNVDIFSRSSMLKICYSIGIESMLRCVSNQVMERNFGEKTDIFFTKIMNTYSLNEYEEYRCSWIPSIENQKGIARETGLYITTKLVEYYADRKDVHEYIHDGIGLLFNVVLHKSIDSYTQTFLENDDQSFVYYLYDASFYNPYGQYLLMSGSKIFFDHEDKVAKQRCDARRQVLQNIGSLGVNTALRVATSKIIKQAEKISYIEKLTNNFKQLPRSVIFFIRELSYALTTYFVIKKSGL